MFSRCGVQPTRHTGHTSRIIRGCRSFQFALRRISTDRTQVTMSRLLVLAHDYSYMYTALLPHNVIVGAQAGHCVFFTSSCCCEWLAITSSMVFMCFSQSRTRQPADASPDESLHSKSGKNAQHICSHTFHGTSRSHTCHAVTSLDIFLPEKPSKRAGAARAAHGGLAKVLRQLRCARQRTLHMYIYAIQHSRVQSPLVHHQTLKNSR